MAHYFISPTDQTDLHIDRDTLAASIPPRWPDAQVVKIEDEKRSYDLEWKILMAHGLIMGSLDRRGQVIVVSGDVRDCAEFAIWARAQIPATYPLVFWDEGYDTDVPLEAHTRASDVWAQYLVDPPSASGSASSV